MTYNEFIQNILDTRGRFNIPKDEYKERHHIIPRCMGGSNDIENLIDLYPKEHFIAHRLLYDENKDNYKLAIAYSIFLFNLNDNDDIYVLAQEYENEKLKVIEQMSIYMKNNNPAKREDVKIKLSKNHADVSGSKNPMYGSHRFGKENPMYGKGYKLAGGKNGRAIKIKCINNDMIFDCALDAIN